MKKKYLIVFLFLLFQVTVFSQNTAIATNDTLIKQENKPIITRVVDWYMHHLNYYSVVVLMTVESSFIPFPSEVVIPPAAYAACKADNENLHITDYKFINILIVVLFGTLGALFGAFINYFLSLYLGRPVVYKFADSKLGRFFLLDSSKIKKAEDYFIKHGNISTFIGRLLPGIRQLISIPAGLSKMKLLPFILYTALGAFSWNVILAFIGYIAHGEQDVINKYSHELSYILLGLGLIVVAYLFYKAFKKKNNNNRE